MFFKKKVHTWNDLADNSNRFLPRDNKDIAIYINANEWIDFDQKRKKNYYLQVSFGRESYRSIL